jgi:5,6,7,8-tetrahydromethanopterin hydro-lyase
VRGQYGEAYSGTGVDAAHVNTVLGPKDGPVEIAWATAMATPREGHAAFVVVASPNVPVMPMTLFVNKATIASREHATITWGAAQLGVAAGVIDAVEQTVIAPHALTTVLLIVAVWVDPAARDADAVFAHNRDATTRALARGADENVDVSALLAARGALVNGYYRPTA